MQRFKTGKLKGEFDLIGKSRSVQAGMVTLKPGGTSSDEPENEHRRSEQWLFVLSGTGEATIGKRRSSLRRVKLVADSLLHIEKGELHQIKNTGRKPFRTINFYAPPAYDSDGDAIPRK
jgi:mannose-6-phosphate isomerase-like protein (cupin superfamily)